MENYPVTPDCILAGLGGLERSELAGMIALIDNAKLLNLAEDLARKTGLKLKLPLEKKELEDEISAVAREIDESTYETGLLRHRLWCKLQDGFGVDCSLPLSTRAARRESVKLGHKVSEKLSPSYSSFPKDAPRSKRVLDWAKRRAPFFESQKNLEFRKIVEIEMGKILGILLREDLLDEETKSHLTDKIRDKFEDIPTDLKDEELKEAISSENWKIVGAILAGGSIGGLALAVELAGFSAYILAAKASAIIPLIGGKTMVCLLSVLANPASLAIVAVAGWFALSGVSSSVKLAVATRITVLLALKGIVNRENGFTTILNDFRGIDLLAPSALSHLSPKQREIMAARRKRIEELAGHAVSNVPGPPPPPWDSHLEKEDAESVGKFLSSDGRQEHHGFDVAATATLTAGDFLYTIWSIDPMVIKAADFSRTEDIGNIFEFAAFAERWAKMSASGAQGLENSLQGYTAEQLVLTRLVENGHAVELAEVSNAPGFDILVDGEPFQIKCGGQDNISLLSEHFEKYENIPVIANTELAETAEGKPWTDQVFTVEDFDLETVREMMSVALDAGVGIDDIPVPFYAAIVGVARNLQDLKNGHMGLSDLPGEIAVDVAIRGTLALVGVKAGAVAGLVLFGPAGAVILPYVGGVASLGFVPKVRGEANKVLLRDWSEEVVDIAVSLQKNALYALDRRVDHLKRDLATSHDPNFIESWLFSKKLDDIIASAEQRVDIESQTLSTASDASCLFAKVVAARLFDPSIREMQSALVEKLCDKPKTSKILRKDLQKNAEKAAGWAKQKVSRVRRKSRKPETEKI